MSESNTPRGGLSAFEKYLVAWIAICIVAGLALSQLIPGIALAIDSVKIGTVSIPIGICLFLMMYPAVLNLKASELRKLKKNPAPIIVTLVSNWIIAPLVGVFLAGWLLAGNEQLVVAVILLHASPCTAMVLVWGYLAGGNQEQNVVNTSINTVTIIFLYAPVVGLLIGLQNIAFSTSIAVDWIGLLITASIFIGLPIVAGILSKKYLVSRKGEGWFVDVYKKRAGNVAIVALLITLVVLFALNGSVLVGNPLLLVQVSIPLLLSFAVVVSINIIVTKLLRFKYKEAIITVIIGSSSHFEIAIASAISLYGVGSVAALGTTMGLFWEVPIMLGLVYLGKWLGTRGFWPKNRQSRDASVVFACVGNSSRSQMAEAFARKYLPPGTTIVSAGTRPAAKVDPTAVAAMAEIGIDISAQAPKALTTKMLSGASHFISMGCGVLDSCPFPLVKGIDVQDWAFEDTKGADIAVVRAVRDGIARRMKDFARELEHVPE